MTQVIILGTASAVPDSEHENTHLAILGKERSVLIDCAGSPVQRLQKAGIDINNLTDLVLTHFHPDHVSGVPALLMNMWLTGRTKSLNVYGLHYTLDRVERLMEFYSWAAWPDFFPVAFVRLPETEIAPVLDCPELKIYSSPVCHLVPTIGLRMEVKQNGKVLAYSCDTEPCDNVIRLAKDADVLIHEATGAMEGHSSAAQAGEIARKAGSSSLYLIHYSTGEHFNENLVQEAQETFGGPVQLAEDFMRISFD
jgi:ribonuclease Z